ncbi:MAG: cyclic nucleotide-binding domain-containing protein [Beijerinckiaceae bacterium]|nr:cyclic nucleotide-binding domain-containing protein [Beijerinckiaceae bacterium]
MLEGVLQFFDWPYGIIRNHFFEITVIIIWAEAIMAVGAAYAKRMIPLRTMAMLGNVLGIAAGASTGSLALFLKHAVNLPLNAVRLKEMNRLIAKVRGAGETDLRLDWLKPFMHPRALKAGSQVFSKGDIATEAFLLVEGRVVIPEKSAEMVPGEIFGEMALFTDGGKRTASAICASDARLLVITYEQFEQLYFQNPEFGLYLVRLIVRRLGAEHEEPGAARVSAAG